MRAVLLALLALAPAAQEEPVPGGEPAAGRAPSPDVLRRTPADLPRAEPGRWDGLFDPDRGEDVLAEVGAEGRALLGRAEERYRLGDFPGAIESLHALLEREPDFPPALLVLATTHFRLRRYGDTRDAAERFVAHAPGQVWRTQVLGHAYYSLGEYERAREHYGRVLDAMPEELGSSVEALRGLALSHARLGDEEGALELLDRVLELEPRHAEAHTWKARLLHERGELEAALAEADRARELDPWAPQPWYLVTRVLFALEREDEAEEAEKRWRELDRVAQEARALDAHLRVDPGAYGHALRLAEVQASVENVPAVRRALARAVLARPPDVREVDVRILVLDALESLGDAHGARAAARALEETCPDEPDAWKRLERYYALRRDVRNQIRCGEMHRRMTGEDDG